MRESYLQSKVRAYLRSQGAWVLTLNPQPGIPTGFPDLLALYKDTWIAIEVKKTPTSAFQPLQKEVIAQLERFNPYVFVVHRDNWEQVKLDLEMGLFSPLVKQ